MTGKKQASYVRFAEGEPKARTRTWRVVADEGGALLGRVMWYGPWRCYAFYPQAGSILERTCLRDIAAWCEERSREQLRRRKASAG